MKKSNVWKVLSGISFFVSLIFLYMGFDKIYSQHCRYSDRICIYTLCLRQKQASAVTCTYDFGENNDSLNRVNLIIQLSENYDGTTEDALWTIMNFYYKNIGTSPDVNAGTASCIWKTGQSTIELFCTFASSGLFFITYLPLA